MNEKPNGSRMVTAAADEAAVSGEAGTASALPASPVVAEAVRSGFTESLHRGRVAGLDAGGQPVIQAGAVESPFFPRSANKPVQAAAMLRCGLDLESKLLALAAASHSGEEFHLAGVREILAGAGLDEDALQCPAALPLDVEAAQAVVRGSAEGAGPRRRVYMNCSGKHAAMLATCVAAGWPAGSYRDPEHPLQRAIRDAVQWLTGEPVAATGIDGCGAPLFAVSPLGLARAFRALVTAGPGTPERAVADAVRTYPEWASGTRRPERALMAAVPGLLVKGGAEGVLAFALPDGRAGAVKIDDGAQRAVIPVTVAALRALGVTEPVTEPLDDLATVPLTGGDGIVGEIRATSAGWA
jgi:L-asparaginase II